MSNDPEEPQGSEAPPARAGRAKRSGEPWRFQPEVLYRSILALPLLKELAGEGAAVETAELYPVIIDLNLEYPGGRRAARKQVKKMVAEAMAKHGGPAEQGLDLVKSRLTPQYLFGRLSAAVLRELVRMESRAPGQGGKPHARAIYRIWPDFRISGFLTRTTATVKADAARASFAAQGEGIVWAVMDSGVDGRHPHFAKHKNLRPGGGLRHRDFTSSATGGPLVDACGHGTHVAGIISGELAPARGERLVAATRFRDEENRATFERQEIGPVSGIAPRCKLLSVKVLEDDGSGQVSNLIAAIGYIQELNGHGRRIRVHGVNLSVGYDFEPEWFACGQSPLCVEVDRLVRSGVVVVTAAGNTGYGYTDTEFRGVVPSGIDLTINDPGNAELAITVGSTHRDMPHMYGVSYFSSKGPTGDGRLKPDLVAPGEKIISCSAGDPRDAAEAALGGKCLYREESGTSMAAPHVSGVIAAFLSVRHEFIGLPERVKEIFLSTATDLGRERYFQGRGLVDLMRAIQSI